MDPTREGEVVASVDADEGQLDRERPRRQSRLRRTATRTIDDTSPVERLVLRTPAAFRRRLVAAAALAIIALAIVAGFLAWRQYRANQHRAVNDLNARVLLVGTLLDSAVSGGMSTLETAAVTPIVLNRNIGGMSPYFKRVNAGGGKLFTAGIAWIDTSGELLASSTSIQPLDVSDRDYFQRVMATKAPYVSSGLVGRTTGKPTVVVAVPTFDAAGRLTGVLSGGIVLKLASPTGSQSTENQELGFDGLTIVDRAGHLITSELASVENPSVLARMEQRDSGDLQGTPGLDGGTNHVIAFGTAKTLDWKVAIDRSEWSLYSSARRSLAVDLGSIGIAVLVALLILVVLARRSRRELEQRGEHAQAWSRLTHSLAAAATPGDVAEAVLDAVQETFAEAVAVVAVESEQGQELRAASSLPGWRRVPGDTGRLRAIAELAHEGPRTVQLDRSGYRELYDGFGRRLKALHSVPIVDASGEPSGGIGLLTAGAALSSNEWDVLGAYATQAARALDRARAFEHEHDLAVRLQRSLLPSELPHAPGIALVGEYVAGGLGIEVGGDWYDAVLRPDGILELCIGDVSGRGIGAATVMGRQRSLFRAYAYDVESPAEILRRMIRHVADDEMITAACVTIDPVEGLLTYSCAGHPPPLLLDRARGEVIRLDGASSPPLGVAEQGDVIEARIDLPESATLALYTDGLVERRGENIEDGIDALARALAPGIVSAEDVLAEITGAIGAPSDDVALLVTSLQPAASVTLELNAEPGILPGVRRRLRAWLRRRGFQEAAPEVVLAVSEALNNAIEHGYRGLGGVIRLSLEVDEGRLSIEISDEGSWRPEHANDERGRGLMLMRSLMDAVEVETNGKGTSVRLERRTRPDTAAVVAGAAR